MIKKYDFDDAAKLMGSHMRSLVYLYLGKTTDEHLMILKMVKLAMSANKPDNQTFG